MNRRLALLLGFLVAACTEEPTRPTATDLAPLEDGTVRVNVEATPQRDEITIITLRIDAKSLALGAYQGRFRFDPAVLEFMDYSVPEGDYRVVNPNSAKDGEIRYAGFTVQEFQTPIAVVLRFHSKRVLQLSDLKAELEVVGDVLGREVQRERILKPHLQIAR